MWNRIRNGEKKIIYFTYIQFNPNRPSRRCVKNRIFLYLVIYMAQYTAKYYKRSRKSAPSRSRRVARKASRPYKNRARRAAIKHIRVKYLTLGTSFSKTSLRPNKMGYQMKKKYWLGAKNCWQSNYTSSIAASGASNQTQNHFQVSYFTPDDMNNALSAYSIQPGASGDNDNTNRVFWNKVISETLMTNSSNCNVSIDIYTMSSKKDSQYSPQSQWLRGMYDQSEQTILDLTNQNYGLTPLDTVAVTSLFKCYKVTHVMLSPGQSHKHTHTQHICRPYNNASLDQSLEGTDTALRGLTHFDLIVVRSSSVESGSNNALTGIAPCKVNYYVTKKYEFKYIFDMSTNYKYASVPVEPTTGNVIYNQGSGTFVAPTAL